MTLPLYKVLLCDAWDSAVTVFRFRFVAAYQPPHCRYKIISGTLISLSEFDTRFYVVVAYGPWQNHVCEFWDHRHHKNILFLLYEDVHEVIYFYIIFHCLFIYYDKFC